MRIGYYFGIPIKVNPFFILLLAIAFFFGKLQEALLLFAIVLWHESFHVLIAKVYRLQITDIELLPCGGVTRMDALLQLNPEVEWLVAVAGPLSNGLLVFLAYGFVPYLDVDPTWFDFFVQANIGMAVFNLIPALPLDGGRVLRSLLAKNRGFKDATRIAAVCGQVLSIVFGGWGAYLLYLGALQGVLYLLSGIMLFLVARQEQKNASYVFMRYLTHKRQELRLKRVLVAREIVATAETSLGEVLQHFQPPCYHLIWILDLQGEVVGFLGEVELIGALFEHGLSHKIGAVKAYRIFKA